MMDVLKRVDIVLSTLIKTGVTTEEEMTEPINPDDFRSIDLNGITALATCGLLAIGTVVYYATKSATSKRI